MSSLENMERKIKNQPHISTLVSHIYVTNHISITRAQFIPPPVIQCIQVPDCGRPIRHINNNNNLYDTLTQICHYKSV